MAKVLGPRASGLGRETSGWLAAIAGAVMIACGPPPNVPTVSLRVIGGPPNASVTVDDIFVGNLELVMKRGVALPAGTHHISVEAPGHLPWDKTVEAKEGQGPLRLEVKLVPVPD
ncbi:MAG TPA: PEGA domain-containing protein [Labilithrix sp.]|nr:PEGA domain-containing protein [Labilithrix sp.]